MAEYIEKQALLKKMHSSHTTPLLMGHTTDEDVMFKTMVSIVDEQPTADVVEVKRGCWIFDKDNYTCDIDPYRCSICQGISNHKRPYCSLCGAKMDGERKCDK